MKINILFFIQNFFDFFLEAIRTAQTYAFSFGVSKPIQKFVTNKLFKLALLHIGRVIFEVSPQFELIECARQKNNVLENP